MFWIRLDKFQVDQLKLPTAVINRFRFQEPAYPKCLVLAKLQVD